MSSYVGPHAGWYDLFYAEKPYEQEAAFVDWCLREHGEGRVQRVLEVACGTGRHASALAALGYDVLATDYSRDMLAQAESRPQQIPGVRFRWADMRALRLDEPPFDAAMCLFDSIGYVQTNEAVLAAFRGVARHLRPRGLLVLEFWHAAAMLRSFEPVRVRRWSTEEGEVIRISHTTLQPEQQTGQVNYRVLELRHDGTYFSLEETQTNRYFQAQEMRALLSAGGFETVHLFAGFSATGEIKADTWHIVALARKLEPATPQPYVENPRSAREGRW
jgi:ubiquinone/menaquinone biosynthesis C-methylase UbiE